MKDLLFFDEMITPKILTVVFWIGLALILISSVISIFSFTTIDFIKGLLTLILGPIILRFYCEFMIVLFKINDNIKKLADKEQAE